MKPTNSDNRSTILPYNFLDSELTAAPLTARSALRTGLVSLDCRLIGDSERLWREIEPQMLSRFPGMSIDELVLRRDQAWFGDQEWSSGSGGSAFDLVDVFRNASRRLLTINSGGRAHLFAHSGTGLVECRRRLRWMTFALPPDLLVAVAGAASSHLDILSPNIAKRLEDRCLAETHLHLKAAITFPGLWASTQKALTEPDAQASMFASPGADFEEGRELGPWLIRAFIIRVLLALFLSSPTLAQSQFLEWLRRIIPDLRHRFGATAIDLHLASALRDLAQGSLDSKVDFVSLRHLYANLISAHHQNPPKSLVDLQHCDAIYPYFPGNGTITPEFRFLRAAFDYLSGDIGSRDVLFAKLFWQCVRMRVAFYRHVVQRPMTPGLLWFTRTYERLRPARRPLGAPIFLESAAQLGGKGLRSLEVRITSERDMAALKTVVDQIDQSANKLMSELPHLSEVGLVFHFPRYRGERSSRGSLSAWGRDVVGDPRDNPSGYRFGSYYSTQRFDAVALGRLLATFPRTLEIIRGIDLCTDELAVPLWVMRPLIHYVQSAGEIAAGALDREASQPGLSPRPALRLTFHTGEDWVHLLGGIRRIGEVLELLSMSEGDRLGHALALGTDPEAWTSAKKKLAVTREERLLDLIWAWGFVSEGTNPELLAWLPWLRSQLSCLSMAIFHYVYHPEELLDFSRRLHNSSSLSQIGFPNGPAGQPRNTAEELMVQWIRSDEIFRRSQAIEVVELGPELELIRGLQHQVRRLVAQIGITIETNPSSNLLIGHLGALSSHPMWRLRPPMTNGDFGPSLHLCVGSDDPITFATSLPEEYQLLLDSMLEAGLSTEEAEEWLDTTRRRGLTSRFTVRRSSHNLMTPISPTPTLPILRP